MPTSVPARDDTPSLALIDGFVLDCLLSDNHTFDSEITEFPVESGAVVSDNIRPKPLVIAMEAIVSDTPLAFAGNFRSAGSVPSFDAYTKFLAIRRDRRLVSITTSLDTYDNMALESLSVPRASGRGEEFRFNATFKQVQLVENRREKRVAVPGAKPLTRKNTTIVREPGVGIRYLDFQRNQWYDPEIYAWRVEFRFNLKEALYFLFKGRPDDIPDVTWSTMGGSQTTDATLRARELKRQGGKPQNFVHGRLFRGIKSIMPDQYVIITQEGNLNVTPSVDSGA